MRIAATGTAYLECGGLPPLFAVPACRDVLQDRAIREHRRLPGRGLRVLGLLGSGEASLARLQRRQAAALHMLRGDANARMIGRSVAKHLRPYNTTSLIAMESPAPHVGLEFDIRIAAEARGKSPRGPNRGVLVVRSARGAPGVRQPVAAGNR